MEGPIMGDFSVREEREFHNLAVEPRCMHHLDVPSGCASALAKENLAHQLRFSAKALESKLLSAGTPHVLQAALAGHDDHEPSL